MPVRSPIWVGVDLSFNMIRPAVLSIRDVALLELDRWAQRWRVSFKGTVGFTEALKQAWEACDARTGRSGKGTLDGDAAQ